jgi:hypothetical protein
VKVDVRWQNEEQTIIYYRFKPGWSWEDIHEAFEVFYEMVTPVTHQVNVVMDFTGASMIPQGALSRIRWAFNNPKPDHIGLTVVVAPSSFFQALMGLAQKMWGSTANKWMMTFVTSEAESYRIIEEWKATHGQ